MVLMEPKWNVKNGDAEEDARLNGINGTKVECKEGNWDDKVFWG